MSVRERSIALFEDVHAKQLAHAQMMLLHMPRGAMWRIALRERLTMAMLDEELPCDTITVIDVRLTWNGKQLEAADEPSRKAIEAWEERYGNDMPWVFDVPLAMMESANDDRNQAGSSGAG